ncbi:MAG: acyl-ACP--UDP-N-acetylglucosamine O-acyltransferase [Candidatus Omnitrophica bacterium]|nr:acyl-ACP--UDP-N-acetylglucosamine O-acyltransferase [Candidatus Omnitrophota bacterium]
MNIAGEITSTDGYVRVPKHITVKKKLLSAKGVRHGWTRFCSRVTIASMSKIHPTAIIGQRVDIGTDTNIGPYVIIEDDVKMGCRNSIGAGSYICSGTEIGDDNEIHMHAIIGHTPQDLAYQNERTFTRIGHRNKIREFVTIHRGTKAGTATVIGNDNFIMAYCHIAHNCILGNRVIMVNQASLTGYVEVEDGAFLSGITGFHQFTRIGRLAMVSALSACNKDIPPYMTCGGRPGVVLGINVVGLRRAGIPADVREEIKQAYKLLYRSGLNVSQAVAAIKKNLSSQEVAHLVQFIEESKRGIVDGSGCEEETIKPRKN